MPLDVQQPTVDDTLSKATEQLIETLPAQTPSPAPSPVAGPAPAPEPATDDVDEIELREARAALKAEQTGSSVPPALPAETPDPAAALPKPAAAKDPASLPAAAPAAAGDDEKPMIPKARLDEVLRKAEEARNAAAYWQGIAEARKDMPGQSHAKPSPTDTPAPPSPTIPQLLTAIDTQRVALATKYDAGEIDAVEWEKQRSALDNQAHEIRLEQIRLENLTLKSETLAEAQKVAMQQSLDENAAALDRAHPALFDVKSEDHWAFLRSEAARTLANEGFVLRQHDLTSQKVFHERIASLADLYVPIWTGKPLPVVTKPGSSPAPAVPAPVPSSKIADQRQRKIDLAHQQPPDSAQLGSSGTKPELSEANILSMSDDEIANLPAATRARMTGRAA